MSRTKAKANLSMDEYRETMKGIYTTSINENTLDEAPMAYKSLYVKVMPSDPKTIPFYERYGFQQYDNYSAMVRKHFL